jgi:hypothetical protein
MAYVIEVLSSMKKLLRREVVKTICSRLQWNASMDRNICSIRWERRRNEIIGIKKKQLTIDAVVAQLTKCHY